jgi:hypothetical protein
MKCSKLASVPLILNDPYFSIWSPYDHLNDGPTTHWSGNPSHLGGVVIVDGVSYRFLGAVEPGERKIPQVSLEVTATRTICGFANDHMAFSVVFLSPLFLDDLPLASRPLSYLKVSFSRVPAHGLVQVDFTVDGTVVSHDGGAVTGYVSQSGPGVYGMMGNANQSALSESGDKITVNWGYVYLASGDHGASLTLDTERKMFAISLRPDGKGNANCVIAYDQEYVVDYFGSYLRGYWHTRWATMEEAIKESLTSVDEIEQKAIALDESIEAEAKKCINDSYALLCALSYRVAIAAHQLALGPDGQLLCFSKENSSNGCIATVDVSYPSVPLFLLFGTECVKGMLEPIFTFAGKPAWNKPYAPHDVGRFPHATGQVYGLNGWNRYQTAPDFSTSVYPPFAEYPASADLYDEAFQMPVEECGNMLLMTASVVLKEGNLSFAKEHMELLQQWVAYLVQYGLDPGNQLCTDDFAGHLAHNANLAVKAVLGIQAYAILCEMDGRKDQADHYHQIAMEYAKKWEGLAQGNGHTTLTYGEPESWSLKYNMVWDRLFGSNLFSDAIQKGETAWYQRKLATYGIPLDNRKTYTKSDWEMWVAAWVDDPGLKEAIADRLADYVQESSTRIPFSDWYDTQSGEFISFIARSVQGGIFMPLLVEKGLEPHKK